MKPKVLKCTQPIGATEDVRQRVRTIQASMGEACHACFSAAELDNLKVVVRLTVEFHSYLHLSCGHLFCLEYACESIFSGVDSYRSTTHAYKVLVGATESRIVWNAISIPLLPEQFAAMFDEFDGETNFENKCRLLLDLFKLQIVFAGVSYD